MRNKTHEDFRGVGKRMSRKEERLNVIIESGVVAVIRVSSADDLVNICSALADGGIKAVEITMTSPGALEAISETTQVLNGKAIVGAGSVIDAETARSCILAGAEFIVGPILDLDMVRLCNRYGKIVIPGAFSPTEILTCWEAGVDVVKVFPATSLGPSFIKDVLGPLPQVKLMPTGGIDINNVSEYINAGAACVGVGSALVDKTIVHEKRWDDLTERARQYVSAVKEARARV